MTYGEKYKTAKERIRAFEKYHEEGCSHCETCPSHNVRCFGSKTAKGYLCYQSWLDLEDDNEKPMNCPFCGGEVTVHRDTPEEWVSCHCGYSSKMMNHGCSVAAHNRVCKAVKAYEKGEAK